MGEGIIVRRSGGGSSGGFETGSLLRVLTPRHFPEDDTVIVTADDLELSPLRVFDKQNYFCGDGQKWVEPSYSYDNPLWSVFLFRVPPSWLSRQGVTTPYNLVDYDGEWDLTINLYYSGVLENSMKLDAYPYYTNIGIHEQYNTHSTIGEKDLECQIWSLSKVIDSELGLNPSYAFNNTGANPFKFNAENHEFSCSGSGTALFSKTIPQNKYTKIWVTGYRSSGSNNVQLLNTADNPVANITLGSSSSQKSADIPADSGPLTLKISGSTVKISDLYFA